MAGSEWGFQTQSLQEGGDGEQMSECRGCCGEGVGVATEWQEGEDLPWWLWGQLGTLIAVVVTQIYTGD